MLFLVIGIVINYFIVIYIYILFLYFLEVLHLQAGGTDATEVNKYLLKHCTGSTREGKEKRLRSLKNVLKKGVAFWKERQSRVQVGKHSLNKRGGRLKRVCRTSEARGCRAPGGGRQDRFAGYKAAVKQTFALELENGQEVCGVPGLGARPAHNTEIWRFMNISGDLWIYM